MDNAAGFPIKDLRFGYFSWNGGETFVLPFFIKSREEHGKFSITYVTRGRVPLIVRDADNAPKFIDEHARELFPDAAIGPIGQRDINADHFLKGYERAHGCISMDKGVMKNLEITWKIRGLVESGGGLTYDEVIRLPEIADECLIMGLGIKGGAPDKSASKLAANEKTAKQFAHKKPKTKETEVEQMTLDF